MSPSSAAPFRTRRRLPAGDGIVHLCRFAAGVVRGEPVRAARALAAARAAGIARVAAEEAGLMLVLYAGFPAALEGLRVLNRVWPGTPHGTPEGAPRTHRIRGEALCRRVYGPVYPRLLASVQALHPDLATWMVEHGYGRVLSRAGLGCRERERVTVAVLAATGWRRQLVSHLLGARRLGVDPRGLRAAFVAGRVRAHATARHEADAAWREAERAGAKPHTGARTGGRARRGSARATRAKGLTAPRAAP